MGDPISAGIGLAGSELGKGAASALLAKGAISGNSSPLASAGMSNLSSLIKSDKPDLNNFTKNTASDALSKIMEERQGEGGTHASNMSQNIYKPIDFRQFYRIGMK